MPPPKQFVGVRLPPDLLAEAKAVAAEEDRTLSNYLLSLVRKDITERKTRSGNTIEESAQKYKTPESEE